MQAANKLLPRAASYNTIKSPPTKAGCLFPCFLDWFRNERQRISSSCPVPFTISLSASSEWKNRTLQLKISILSEAHHFQSANPLVRMWSHFHPFHMSAAMSPFSPYGGKRRALCSNAQALFRLRWCNHQSGCHSFSSSASNCLNWPQLWQLQTWAFRLDSICGFFPPLLLWHLLLCLSSRYDTENLRRRAREKKRAGLV